MVSLALCLSCPVADVGLFIFGFVGGRPPRELRGNVLEVQFGGIELESAAWELDLRGRNIRVVANLIGSLNLGSIIRFRARHPLRLAL
jgi:hypothetical protein